MSDSPFESRKDVRRADHQFDTKLAAEAVGCCPRKFSDWLYRSRRKFLELCIVAPGPTAAEFMSIMAAAESERQRRQSVT